MSYGISNIFEHGGCPPFWILKILIFDHVTVIVVLISCCLPNFNKIGSRVWPPDAHNCFMFNARLLSNGRYHGNHITAATSGTRWDATTQVSYKFVHWWASNSISNIFQYGGRPPFWILKILIFDHVTVIVVLICCCSTKFQQNWITRLASRCA